MSNPSAENLTPVAETLLIPLAARAMQPAAFPDIGLNDPVAAAWIERLGADVTRYQSDRASMRGACVRTKWFDDRCAEFLHQRPDAIGVSIGCGLNATATRVSTRLHTSSLQWVDVDLPEVLDIRRQLEDDQPGHRLLAIDDDAASWVQAVPWTQQQPIVVMAEASLIYVERPIVARTLQRIADRFATGKAPVLFLMDYCSALMVRTAAHHPSLNTPPAKQHSHGRFAGPPTSNSSMHATGSAANTTSSADAADRASSEAQSTAPPH